MVLIVAVRVLTFPVSCATQQLGRVFYLSLDTLLNTVILVFPPLLPYIYIYIGVSSKSKLCLYTEGKMALLDEGTH